MSDKHRYATLAVIIAGWTALVAWVSSASVYLPLSLFSIASVTALFIIDPGFFRALFVVTPRAVAIGVVGAIVMTAMTYGGYALTSALFPAIAAAVTHDYVSTNIAGQWHVLPALTAIVIAEEVVWRGFMLRRDRITPLLIAFSVALYAIAQVGFYSWVVLFLAVGCGLFWTAQRVVSKGIVAPLITHLAWNIAVLIAYPVIL